MAVHTGKFWVIKGLCENGSIDILAVSFDCEEAIEFVKELAEQGHPYLAFRVSNHGGALQQLPTAAATHEGPASKN